jgi:hypothetical protein
MMREEFMMRRGFYTIIITLVFLLVTACGQQEVDDSYVEGDNTEQVSTKGNHNSEQASVEGEQVSLEETSNDPSQEAYPDAGILKITIVGNNKAKVTIESEEVVSLLQMGDHTNEIMAFFDLGETQKINLCMDVYGWDFNASEDAGRSDEFVYYYNDDNPYLFNGNEVSFEIVGVDVGYWFDQCNRYDVMIFGDTEENDVNIASGYMENILSYEDSDGEIEVTFIGDSEFIVNIEGAILDKYCDSEDYGWLKLYFYSPEKGRFLSDYYLDISFFPDGVICSTFYIMENLQENEAGNSWNCSVVDSFGCEVIAKEQEIGIYIQSDDIVKGISECSSVVLEDQNSEKILLATNIENAIEEGSIKNVVLPEIFGFSVKDQDYFYPVTDEYMVMMIELPCVPVFEYGIGYPYGGGAPIYMPIYAHEEPLKVVSIISYSDFGIVDERMKIIYQSEESLAVSACGRLDWCDAVDFTGDAEHDDVLIRDFFEYMDKESFGKSRDVNSEHYVYYGYDGTVRYFKAGLDEIWWMYNSLPDIDINENITFDKDGFMKAALPYLEDFPNFDEGISESRYYDAQVTIWASEAYRD